MHFCWPRFGSDVGMFVVPAVPSKGGWARYYGKANTILRFCPRFWLTGWLADLTGRFRNSQYAREMMKMNHTSGSPGDHLYLELELKSIAEVVVVLAGEGQGEHACAEIPILTRQGGMDGEDTSVA